MKNLKKQFLRPSLPFLAINPARLISPPLIHIFYRLKTFPRFITIKLTTKNRSNKLRTVKQLKIINFFSDPDILYGQFEFA